MESSSQLLLQVVNLASLRQTYVIIKEGTKYFILRFAQHQADIRKDIHSRPGGS